MSPGGQNHPWLRSTASEEFLSLAGLPFLRSAYQQQTAFDFTSPAHGNKIHINFVPYSKEKVV